MVGFGLKIKVIVNLIRMRRTQFHIGDSVEHDPYVPSVHAVAGNAAYAGCELQRYTAKHKKRHHDVKKSISICVANILAVCLFATFLPLLFRLCQQFPQHFSILLSLHYLFNLNCCAGVP